MIVEFEASGWRGSIRLAEAVWSELVKKACVHEKSSFFKRVPQTSNMEGNLKQRFCLRLEASGWHGSIRLAEVVWKDVGET